MATELNMTGAFRAKSHTADAERAHHVGMVIGPDLAAWVARDLATDEVTAMAWAPDLNVLRHADLPERPRSVTYVSLPEWSTLVPDGALEPGTSADHLKLVFGKLPGNAVREEPVNTISAQCLYVNEAAHERTILERFPIARSLPLQAVLVHGTRARSHAGPVLLFHRGAERVDVAIASKGELLLSTSYPARTSEDLLYYCLLATERTGHTPESIRLHAGGTHLTSADRALLSTYFSTILAAVPSTTTGGAVAEPERWLAAFDQSACVS